MATKTSSTTHTNITVVRLFRKLGESAFLESHWVTATSRLELVACPAVFEISCQLLGVDVDLLFVFRSFLCTYTTGKFECKKYVACQYGFDGNIFCSLMYFGSGKFFISSNDQAIMVLSLEILDVECDI